MDKIIQAWPALVVVAIGLVALYYGTGTNWKIRRWLWRRRYRKYEELRRETDKQMYESIYGKGSWDGDSGDSGDGGDGGNGGGD